MTRHDESDYCPYGYRYCTGRCDVCGAHQAFGCGHTGAQQRAQRLHETTAKHRNNPGCCNTDYNVAASDDHDRASAAYFALL